MLSFIISAPSLSEKSAREAAGCRERNRPVSTSSSPGRHLSRLEQQGQVDTFSLNENVTQLALQLLEVLSPFLDSAQFTLSGLTVFVVTAC